MSAVLAKVEMTEVKSVNAIVWSFVALVYSNKRVDLVLFLMIGIPNNSNRLIWQYTHIWTYEFVVQSTTTLLLLHTRFRVLGGLNPVGRQ